MASEVKKPHQGTWSEWWSGVEEVRRLEKEAAHAKEVWKDLEDGLKDARARLPRLMREHEEAVAMAKAYHLDAEKL